MCSFIKHKHFIIKLNIGKIFRIQQEIMKARELETDSQTNTLERTWTITDMTQLRSNTS